MIVVQMVIRWLGMPGLVAIGLIVFYEGVPIGPLRDVPVIGHALSSVVDGRVDRAARQAKHGLVNASTVARLEAQIEGQRQLRALADERAKRALNANSNFATKLTEAAIELEDLNDEINELLARPAPDNCRLQPYHFERMRNNR